MKQRGDGESVEEGTEGMNVLYLGNPGSDELYRRAVLDHLARSGVPDVGADGVCHIEIRHDLWCPRPEGGPCCCNPEVESGERINLKYDGKGDDD